MYVWVWEWGACVADLPRAAHTDRQYKTMNTVDFSDLTEAQKKAFMEHDCVNPPPHFPGDMEPDGDVDGPAGGGSSSMSTLRKRDVEPQVATTDYRTWCSSIVSCLVRGNVTLTCFLGWWC